MPIVILKLDFFKNYHLRYCYEETQNANIVNYETIIFIWLKETHNVIAMDNINPPH